ncbi:DUF3970 family protein [Lentzea sp. NPDC004782]|uniref:DUF3970 family protein n=1 Tax=Lentzea sp. NPDC004782 TaxID=3154458 RepID=UPI0033B3B7E4
MKIRLEGTPQEIEQAVTALREVFEVQEVSGFYKNRGQSVLGRVYVTVQLLARRVVHAEATRITPGKPSVGRRTRKELEN